MDSFISSFRERSFAVFALTGLLVLTASGLNALKSDPQHDELRRRTQFWQHKVHNLPDHAYNIIASGDSRVYRGFSPAHAEQALPGARALNYGFSGGGHNAFMFRQIERLLSEDTNTVRAVILGISPYSLTPKAQNNGEYDTYFRKGPAAWDDSLNDFFRPLSTRRLKNIILNREAKPQNGVYDYLSNGWVKSDWKVRNPQAELDVFRTDFDGNKVDPAVTAALMKQTRLWTQKGIKVIGYRPPTTPDMEAVEARYSGFDEQAFARDFEENGGVWVDPGEDFESYDGSHLTPESTGKLSEILARAIAASAKSP